LSPNKKLILYNRLEIEKLQEFGKDFPWKKPEYCPVCKSKRLWGHGYVIRYFSKGQEGVYLKRWRCPECGAVHTVRPEGFLPRIMTPIKGIYNVLVNKLNGGTFFREFSRQSQQYWWKGFQFQYDRQKRKNSSTDFLREQLHSHGIFTGKALKYRVIPVSYKSPYLTFALTCGKYHCYADP
jgi:transposase-like protein